MYLKKKYLFCEKILNTPESIGKFLSFFKIIFFIERTHT